VKLPSSERLSYLKLLAETALLLLAVPVLLIALLRDPNAALNHAIGKTAL
jgi:hypothetical protein